ncbi:hypothetical protein H310_15030 [Aphanomyces invadans]|uniref:Uncharacterized protein n=1 Tax=Aphanomyces invadans TaxID=157072 RepID=A0A024T9V5_9STRA|nr:hypothetical protein H310_15030 [Aphanomyces invadans]ETV90137.1 hypothetical protein H310_15030 [Aphanomyces invadans]|eukprot:XP_008881232.1 hypothetical protein H310_15030 [Aphanomyces invadans]
MAVTPLDAFNFFENRGCFLVSVFPTFPAGTLHSNTLKVIFSSKQGSGYLSSHHKEDEPLREICSAVDQPTSFVVHKISALNDLCRPVSMEAAQNSRESNQGSHPAPQQQAPAVTMSLPTSKDPPSSWHKKIKARLFPVPTEEP